MRTLISGFFRVLRNDGATAAVTGSIQFVLSKLNSFIKTDEHKVSFKRILKEHEGKPIIIVPAFTCWNLPLFQRPQHLAIELSKLGFLYFFSSNDMFRDEVNGFRVIASSCYITNRFDLVKKLQKKKIIHIYSTDLINKYEQIEAIKNDNDVILYDYIDEISDDISGKVPEFVVERHEKFVKDENVLIICSAKILYNEVLEHRKKNCVLVTNGVDNNHFNSAVSYEYPPDKIQSIVDKRKPIIGYYGALAKWFDYDLIVYIAQKRPEWEIILIGVKYDNSYDQNEDKIRLCPNINYIGPIDYSELPFFSFFFDVAIIPFKVYSVTHATSPLKLFEYMAMKHPIVTTNMQELRTYKSVLIANNHDDFLNKVDEALTLRNNKQYIHFLEQESRDNSWHSKAKLISDLLGSDLPKIPN